MPALSITASQRRELRAQAHPLSPVVHIGQEGLSAAVRRELAMALDAHGLIKVRMFEDSREQREAMFGRIAAELDAAAVQHIGKLLVLWRPPAASAPPQEERGAGPRFVKLVSFSKSGNHRATVRTVKVLGNQRISPGGLIKRKKTRSLSPKKRAQG